MNSHISYQMAFLGTLSLTSGPPWPPDSLAPILTSVPSPPGSNAALKLASIYNESIKAWLLTGMGLVIFS